MEMELDRRRFMASMSSAAIAALALAPTSLQAAPAPEITSVRLPVKRELA